MTGRLRICLLPASRGASGLRAALLFFLLVLGLAHPDAPFPSSSLEGVCGPERIFLAQAALPMTNEASPEKRLGDSPLPGSQMFFPGLRDPLARGFLLLKRRPLNMALAISAREAFNRLLTRILSPLNRRAWG